MTMSSPPDMMLACPRYRYRAVYYTYSLCDSLSFFWGLSDLAIGNTNTVLKGNQTSLSGCLGRILVSVGWQTGTHEC
jgi:hypothetical protein